MVIVKAAHLREGEEKSFVSLELSGDLELVQSQNTGRFYATTRRCFVSSTFDLKTAEGFVGKRMPGTIVKVAADPYDYEIPETGEVITLTHSYSYHPEEGAPAIAKKEPEESDDVVEKEMKFHASPSLAETLDF